MKKHKFYFIVPKENIDYVIDMIKEYNVQILNIENKNLKIMIFPHIRLCHKVTIFSTMNDFIELRNLLSLSII